ncbi:MAG: transglycosylase SLT domain-containing protein [Bacteriovoracia bacterium]
MFLRFFLSFFVVWNCSFAQSKETDPWTQFLDHSDHKISRADLVVYDHFLQIYKVAAKGYASAYLLDKGLKEASRHPRLALFNEWLQDLKRFSNLPHEELMQACFGLREKLTTTFGLERKLVLQRLGYCRQIALQQMAPKALANGGFTITDMNFLKKFMYVFLHGKNQADFIWFLQRFEAKPDLSNLISTLVTEEAVKTNRQIPRDILPLITISPDLTRHIQQYGLDTESMQQVFYTEFSRLLDAAYKAIDSKKSEAINTHAEQLHTWLGLNLQRLPQALSLGRYSDMAKNLWRSGNTAAAVRAFDYVAKHGNVEQREDAWFFRMWIWGSDEKWKDALDWLNQTSILSKVDSLRDSRLKFWIALTLQKVGKSELAKTQWESIIRRHPLSFYGIMANKALQTHHRSSPEIDYYRRIDAKNTPTLTLQDLTPELTEAWRRLRAWSRLDAKSFMNAELRGIERSFIPSMLKKLPKTKLQSAQSDAHLLTAAFIGAEENYLESFRVIYTNLDRERVVFNRFLLNILYPQPYMKELQGVLKKANLDPLILLSLIRQESVFNPGARSRVGARGLMQLMPTTARRLQRGVRDNQLTIPKKNIELGAKYFQQLHKRYDGNLVYILSAYNAGESRVDRWKGQYFAGDDMLRNIEMIPFLETRNYVKLIFRNLFFYKTLVASQEQKDPASPNQIYDVDLGFKR